MKRCFFQDLKESCFLHIKGQPKQFGDGRTQCAIAEALGTLLEGTINHHSAVRNAVIRISNDPEDGNLVNEAAWWHTDMLPSPMPVQYTSLFMVANDAPLGAKFGVTKLVPSDQFYKRQSAETQEAWNKRQWGLDVAVHATLGKGVPANKSVPMIHTHPHKLSNNVAVNIETEPECTGVFDVLPGGGRDFIDKSKFIQELDDKLEEACEDYGAIVEWEAGDYLIFDNMAVLHKAQADAYQTKEQREAAGLPYYRRTLHRVTCLTDLVRYPQLDEE
jgi:alpha-ketoglutarate-dependent taurine dioxygenase